MALEKSKDAHGVLLLNSNAMGNTHMNTACIQQFLCADTKMTITSHSEIDSHFLWNMDLPVHIFLIIFDDLSVTSNGVRTVL